ncbi:MAG: ABC transporter permease [Chloroflexi bacterium]|nr:ABC transporter permease [Chloroflexota bacterium]
MGEATAVAKVAEEVRRKKKTNLTPLLLIIPAGVIYFGFFAPGMLWGFIQSFFRFSMDTGVVSEWNIENYARFLTDPFYLGVLWRTIFLGIVTAFLTLLMGYPVAYFILYRGGRFRGFLVLLVLSPLLVVVVIRALGWIMFLGPSGVLNDLLVGLNIVDRPIKFLFNEKGVIIGLTHIYLPFMVLSILSSLQRIDPSLVLAARNLGASPFLAFFRVTFPLSLPGVFAGVVLVFMLSAGSFVVPQLLGGGKVTVIGTFIYQQYMMTLNWPFGSAVAFVLLIIVVSGFIISTRLLERGKYGVVFQ